MAAWVRSLESLATLPSIAVGQGCISFRPRVWLNPELLKVNKAPYSGVFTPYTSGLNGWVPMLQVVLAF